MIIPTLMILLNKLFFKQHYEWILKVEPNLLILQMKFFFSNGKLFDVKNFNILL